MSENNCLKCGKPIGNDVFTVCDNCWDKKQRIYSFTKRTIPASASAYTRFVYLHDYKKLQAEFDALVKERDRIVEDELYPCQAENERLRKRDCKYCPHNEGGCGYYEKLEGKETNYNRKEK